MKVEEAVVVCTDRGDGLLPVSMALPKFCTPVSKTDPLVYYSTSFLVEHGVRHVVFVVREEDLQWMMVAMQSRALHELRQKHHVTYDVVTYNYDDEFGALRRGVSILDSRYVWTAFANEVIEPHVVVPEVVNELAPPPFTVLYRNAEAARTGRFGVVTSLFDLEDGSGGLSFGGVRKDTTTGAVILTGLAVMERSMFSQPRMMGYLDAVDALAKEGSMRGVLLPHLSFWTRLDTFRDLEQCYAKFRGF